MVQFHQIASQGEADARSHGVHPTVVAIEKTGVEMLHLLFGDADALVADAEHGIVALACEDDIHVASVAVVFHGVREQVVENLVEFVFVEPSIVGLCLTANVQFSVACRHHGTDVLADTADEIRQVSTCHEQPQLSCLRLAHLKNLPQQPGKPLDIVLYQSIVIGKLGSLALHVVYRHGDDGERSEQLVRNVGEEHAHGQTVFGFQIVLIPANDAPHGKGSQQHIQQPCPPREIPWRQHLDLQRIGHLCPAAMTVGSFQAQPVGACREILKGDAVLLQAYEVPVIVVAFQHILIVYLFLVGIGQQGKLDGELIDAGRNGDGTRHERSAVEYPATLDGVEKLIGAVVNKQFGHNQLRMADAGTIHLRPGHKREKPFLTAKEEFLPIAERGIGRESQKGQAVFAAIAGHRRHVVGIEDQPHQRVIGAEPKSPLRIFLYGIDTAAHNVVVVVDGDEAVGGFVVSEQSATVGYGPQATMAVLKTGCGIVNRIAAVARIVMMIAE